MYNYISMYKGKLLAFTSFLIINNDDLSNLRYLCTIYILGKCRIPLHVILIKKKVKKCNKVQHRYCTLNHNFKSK